MRPYRAKTAQYQSRLICSNAAQSLNLHLDLGRSAFDQCLYFDGATIYAERGRLGERMRIGKAICLIRDAFDPLICLVRVYDRDTKVRFHIFDEQAKPIVSVDGLSIRELLNTSRLSNAIREARIRLEKKGFTLKPWMALS